MSRLSSWDLLESSLNPPTMWSSNLQTGKEGEESGVMKEQWGGSTFPTSAVPALLTEGAQRCNCFHKERDLRPGAGAVAVSQAGGSASYQNTTPNTCKNKTDKLLQRGNKAHENLCFHWALPVCCSTTRWQVVASSDPMTETNSVEDETDMGHSWSKWIR